MRRVGEMTMGLHAVITIVFAVAVGGAVLMLVFTDQSLPAMATAMWSGLVDAVSADFWIPVDIPIPNFG